jgi:protein SCO1
MAGDGDVSEVRDETEAARAKAPAGPRILGWVAFAAVVLALPLIALLTEGRPARDSGLPVLAELPTFALTDHRGRPFVADDLDGRVWIANFIFTRCSASCPMLSKRMADLQGRLDEVGLADRVGLLSITVDPVGDTPEQLDRYARAWGAQDDRWIFLTGDPLAVQATVVHGFRVAMGQVPAAGEVDREHPDFDILHGNNLVLVDHRRRIRGYFDPDEAGAASLMAAAAALVREAGPGS